MIAFVVANMLEVESTRVSRARKIYHILLPLHFKVIGCFMRLLLDKKTQAHISKFSLILCAYDRWAFYRS